MQQIPDYSDERLHGCCVFCGGPEETADHVPSRAFLDEPYPENLPCVPACDACNKSFSLDEEYLACLIECVIAGSADPTAMRRPKVARILERKPELGARILACRKQGSSGPIFTPELDRVRNVIVKLARGHTAFEFGEQRFEEPDHAATIPLPAMTQAQRDAFENIPTTGIWPEVGSRAMSRLLITSDGQPFADDWIDVQQGRYRYAAVADGGTLIRLVIGEYLAAEVQWD